MRTVLTLTIALLGCGPRATPPETTSEVVAKAPPTGDYGGTLEGVGIPLVFHLAGPDTTIDSPNQGAFGIKGSAERDADGRVVVLVPSIAGRFDGEEQADGTIVGAWSQGASTFPITLSATAEALKPPTRPQDPVAPFPYTATEVSIPSGEVVLAATVTRPESPGPHPIVVFLTGSGPQDRDEALMGHRPFLVIADHLARKGIGSVRFDDRGVAKSTGDFTTSTIAEFAIDAASALRFARTLDDIGPVGWLGHSEGGIVAPMAARETAPDFFISLAGPGVALDVLMLEQLEDVMAGQGLSTEQIEPILASTREIYRQVHADADEATLRQTIASTDPTADAATVDQRTAMFSSPWMRSFLKHDPTDNLAAMTVPTLALYGDKDVQVAAETNAAGMRTAMADNPALVVKTFEGLNHLFQECNTGMPSEYGTIEQTISPAVLDTISQWVLSL